MKMLAHMRFRTKIITGLCAIVVLTAVTLSVFISRMAADSLMAETRKRGLILAENMAVRAADPLLAMDLLRLKNMVDEAIVVDDEAEYAFVQDEEGQVLVHTYHGGFPVELIKANPPKGNQPHIQLLDTGQGTIYDVAAPILIGGRMFGLVRIGISRDKAQRTVSRLVMAVAGISGGALAAAVILSAIFGTRVSRRINTLRDYAVEVIKGNLDLQTGPKLSRNCWDIMNCGLKECPAYGETRRRCWHLAGTMCPDCADEQFPGKVDSCGDCAVYRENRGDEIQDLAEAFDVMALSLKSHIEELKQAETNLMDQQRLMRTVLDVIPDFVSMQDRGLRYQAVNRAFVEFVGKPLHMVVGSTDEELFLPDEADARLQENMRVIKTRRRTHQEAHMLTGMGPRWFHVVRVPVFNHDNELVGILQTARDVSEIKNFQEQLIQSQKMESMGKLAGGVAHEINTPLGIILGYAQLMLEDVDQESQMYKDIQIIEKQTKVCRKIVADLLGFSRQSESRLEQMDLSHAVMEVISLVRHSFSLDNIDIQVDLTEDMPYMVGDREKLKQVWLNLLTNSRDAMPAGGTIFVQTRLCEIGDKQVIMIVDSGTGIPTDDLDKIFDPFFSTKPVGKGTGLGLSVSFGIIKAHGGRIEVQSPVPPKYRPEFFTEQTTGTAFHIVLPMHPPSCLSDSDQFKERSHGKHSSC
ncbi:MAG: ATP-binding protein [Desulfovibrio sp.]|uniref:ATP-binding protein n=1 Tax=Desulfovibrio sp. 7SRBS1 TaxID=3378064 RepID=UPI003B41068C